MTTVQQQAWLDCQLFKEFCDRSPHVEPGVFMGLDWGIRTGYDCTCADGDCKKHPAGPSPIWTDAVEYTRG